MGAFSFARNLSRSTSACFFVMAPSPLLGADLLILPERLQRAVRLHLVGQYRKIHGQPGGPSGVLLAGCWTRAFTVGLQPAVQVTFIRNIIQVQSDQPL